MASTHWTELVNRVPKVLFLDMEQHGAIEHVFMVGYHSGAGDAWKKARWIPLWFGVVQLTIIGVMKLLGAL